MEVPRLGIKSELQLQSMPQPQQCQICITSVTYTAAYGNAGSLTHWARPGIEPASSWTLVGFLTHWAKMETHKRINFKCSYPQRIKKKKQLCKMLEMLTNPIIMIVSLYIRIITLHILRFFFFFCFFRAAPVAYGGSQDSGRIEAVAASLHHSHSNAGSELCLQPMPQLMAMPDP